MKKIKYISIILTFSYLLNACSFYSKNHVDNSQNIKQDKTKIEDLPDGNYRYCSDPNPYPESEPDVHRYCFTFTKIGNKAVGHYLYRAPKDTPYICIEGKVNNDQVTGVGYELIFGSPEPLTEKDFEYLKNPQPNSSLRYWDNTNVYQGGMNLKVGSPNLHSLMPPSANQFTTYWAVIRYETAQLDLANFESIKLSQAVNFEECSDKKK